MNSKEEVERTRGTKEVDGLLIKKFIKLGSKPKMEVPIYEGNPNVEELLY